MRGTCNHAEKSIVAQVYVSHDRQNCKSRVAYNWHPIWVPDSRYIQTGKNEVLEKTENLLANHSIHVYCNNLQSAESLFLKQKGGRDLAKSSLDLAGPLKIRATRPLVPSPTPTEALVGGLLQEIK